MIKMHLCLEGWRLYDEYGRVLDLFEKSRKHSAKQLADLRAALNNYNAHRANCNNCTREEK